MLSAFFLEIRFNTCCLTHLHHYYFCHSYKFKRSRRSLTLNYGNITVRVHPSCAFKGKLSTIYLCIVFTKTLNSSLLFLPVNPILAFCLQQRLFIDKDIWHDRNCIVVADFHWASQKAHGWRKYFFIFLLFSITRMANSNTRNTKKCRWTVKHKSNCPKTR